MVHTDFTHSLGLALNFEGADVPEWVQLTPAGPGVAGRDGRAWNLTDPQSVVAAFRDNKADLPIDIEHSTQVKGGKGEPAPAVGWIKDIEARNGALWARVEWTEEGRAAVSSRAYRYISPAFRFSKPRGDILAMVSAGLTNTPNLQLAALNNEGGTDPQEEKQQMDKAVLQALKLSEDATAADAVVAINKLKEAEQTALNSAAHPDPASFVPKADYDLAMNRVAEFEKADGERRDAEAEAAVDAAIEAGKIAPASRDYHLATCKQQGGLKMFRDFADTAPVIGGGEPLKDKDAGKGKAPLSAEEIATCRALGMSKEDFIAAKADENEE